MFFDLCWSLSLQNYVKGGHTQSNNRLFINGIVLSLSTYNSKTSLNFPLRKFSLHEQFPDVHANRTASADIWVNIPKISRNYAFDESFLTEKLKNYFAQCLIVGELANIIYILNPLLRNVVKWSETL